MARVKNVRRHIPNAGSLATANMRATQHTEAASDAADAEMADVGEEQVVQEEALVAERELFTTETVHVKASETFHHIRGGQWAFGKRRPYLNATQHPTRVSKQKLADPHDLLTPLGLPGVNVEVSTTRGPHAWPGVVWTKRAEGLWSRHAPPAVGPVTTRKWDNDQAALAAACREMQQRYMQLPGGEVEETGESSAQQAAEDIEGDNIIIIARSRTRGFLVTDTGTLAKHSLIHVANDWVPTEDIEYNLQQDWAARVSRVRTYQAGSGEHSLADEYIIRENVDSLWIVPNQGAAHADQIVFLVQQYLQPVDIKKNLVIIGERYDSNEYLAALVDEDGKIELSRLVVQPTSWFDTNLIDDWNATYTAVNDGLRTSADKTSASHIVYQSSRMLFLVDKTQVGDLLDAVCSIMGRTSTIEEEIAKME